VEAKLPETIEECHSLIRHLFEVVEKMQVRIDELEARLNEDSQNSNRPPSSDGFKKRKSAMPKKKGQRGGQKGHQGKTLKMVADPDVVIECEPAACECGASDWTQTEVIERRQVFDLPEPRLEVVEYQRIQCQCRCGIRVSGKFPEQVSGSTQYGTRTQAMVSLMSVFTCLPHRKIGQLFADLYGYQINEATTQAMVKRTSEVIPLEEIKAGVIKSEVANFDETGINQNGQLNWLHTASTEQLTYQFVDAGRGAQAMRSEKSVLPEFTGVGVHDCWAGYFKFEQMKHALCNAHLLRELTGIIENNDSQWGHRMRDLLVEMYQKSEQGTGVVKEFEKYEKRYKAIIRAGEKEEPPPEKVNQRGKLKRTKGRNLLERMDKHQMGVMLFAKQRSVPFTNNQAERDIRPVKVKQKVSGGFRSSEGMESYTRINSFISTMRKMNRQVFQELRSVIEGKPFVLFQT
jgi:transposase